MIPIPLPPGTQYGDQFAALDPMSCRHVHFYEAVESCGVMRAEWRETKHLDALQEFPGGMQLIDALESGKHKYIRIAYRMQFAVHRDYAEVG